MSGTSLCVNCSVQFTLFKRKNRCTACKLLYCSTCIKKGEHLPRRNVKQCLKCHVLSAQPFIKAELMLLSVKDLKGFLEQQNMSSTGCTEKGDLVDVIISYQARSQVWIPRINEPFTNESHANESHHNEQRNRSHPNTQPSSGSSSSQQQTRTQNASRGTNNLFSGLRIDPNNITDFVQSMFNVDETGVRGLRPESRDEFSSSRNDEEMSYSPNYNQAAFGSPNFHQWGYSTSNYQQGMPSSEDITPTCVHPTQVKTRSTISLDSFQEKSDISKLSAKELKALLDDNFVDYKGCVEKEELVDRVVMLWESTKLQQQQLGSGSMDTSSKAADENEICKVCMDRVIDCVFLECGHLVTCVDCGRQLRECPLCRQNIVRTVRVFKS